jgi:membrane-bound serine protease (ClpP class)
MHAWLGLLAGILVVAGGLLIFSASIGIATYGLTLQIEGALAIILLLAAGIAAWLFYVGVKAQHKRVKTGKEALIGAKGVATTELKPKGEVRVLGEFWQAIAKDATIANGHAVEVVCLEGMFLVVKPTEEKLNSPECQ